MKKMRKMVSLALTAAMTAGLMTGMGALTASADSERTKITALLKGTESTEQFQTFDYLLKNFCDEKGLDYEIELVNDMQDYFTKLQMYINSDTLPDIFGCPNGTLKFIKLSPKGILTIKKAKTLKASEYLNLDHRLTFTIF